MLGKRSSQRSLFDAEYHFRHLVGEASFHWQLSQVRDRLFRNEEFADLYLSRQRPPLGAAQSLGHGAAAAGP